MTDLSLLRLDDVRDRTSLSRSEIYRRMAGGTFPKSITITGSRSCAWASDEVSAWIANQIATASRVGVNTEEFQ